MLTRALTAIACLALPALVLPAGALAASPHHGHHAARVSTATFRTPLVAKPGRELRASRHEHVVRTRYAAGRHHPLTRGS